MAESGSKELKISVIIDAKQARTEIANLAKYIESQFARAGVRVSKLFGFEGLKDMGKQLGNMKEMLDKMGQAGQAPGATITPIVDTEKIKQQVAEVKQTIEQVPPIVPLDIDEQGIKEKTSRVGKDLATFRTGVIKDMSAEDAAALKQYQANLQARVLAQKKVILETAKMRSIARAGEEKMYPKMGWGTEQEYTTYLRNWIKEEAKKTAALRGLVDREAKLERAIDIKKMKQFTDTAKMMGIPPQVLKSYNIAEQDLKTLLNLYPKLTDAIALGGQKAMQKRIRDVTAGVIVKQQGTEQGAGIVSERDISRLNTLLQKYPQLKDHIEHVTGSLDKQHGRFSKLVETTRNYIKFQTGWFLGATVIFGTIGAIIKAIKSFLEFEQTMKTTQAVTGATDKEMKMLAETAKNLSRETPLAATEISKIALQIMRAGLGIKETTAAMEAATKIAVISGEDVKAVADTVASVFMIWKLGVEDAAKAGTVLAAALNYSKLNIEDFGTALNYVGGMASTMKISLEETAGVLSAISNLGVRASTMATGWRQFVAEMAAPSKKLSEFLTKNKADFDQLNLVRLEGPNKMVTILTELERVGFGAEEAMSLLERRAAAFFMALKAVGPTELANMIEKMKDMTAYQEGLKKVMEGPIAMFKRFGQILVANAINIGHTLMPVIRGLMVVLTMLASLLERTVKIMMSWPGLFVMAATTVYLLWGSIMSLITAFKKLITVEMIMYNMRLPQMFMALAETLRFARASALGLAETMMLLNGVMAKNPWTLILMVITALVGTALIDWLLDTKSAMEKLNEEGFKMADAEQEAIKKGQELKTLFPEMFQDTANAADVAASSVSYFKQELDSLTNVDLTNVSSVFAEMIPQIVAAQKGMEEAKKQLREIKEITEEKPDEEGWFWRFLKGWDRTFGTRLHEVKAFLESRPPVVQGPKEEYKGYQLEKATMEERQALWGAWSGYGTELKAVSDISNAFVDYRGILLSIVDVEKQRNKIALEGAVQEMESISKTKEMAETTWEMLEREAKMKAAISKEGLDPKEIKALYDTYIEQLRVLYGTDETKFKSKANKVASAAATALLSAYKKQLQTRAKEDPYDLARSLYKDYLEDMKNKQELELERLKHHNEMLEIAEQMHTAKMEAVWNEQTWLLNTFYKEGLSDAQAYFDQRKRIMEEQYQWEIQKIQDATDREREELERQAADLREQMTSIYGRMAQIREDILEETGEFTIGDLLLGGDREQIARTVEGLSDSIKKVLEPMVAEYMNWNTEVGKLSGSLEELLNTIIRLNAEGILKLTEAELKHIEAMRKENYEAKIAIALNDLKLKQFMTEKQLELNKVMLEANEIAGNWNEVYKLRTKILQEEGELTRNQYQQALKKLDVDKEINEAELKRIEQLIECNEKSEEAKTIAESNIKRINLEKEAIERLSTEWEKLQAIKERRTKMMETPEGAMGLAIEDEIAKWENFNQRIYDMTVQTFDSMGQTLSDVFFDSMTGQLKTALDYWRAFVNSISRMLSDLLAEWVKIQWMKLIKPEGNIAETLAPEINKAAEAAAEAEKVMQIQEEVIVQAELTGVLSAQIGVVTALTAAYTALAAAKAAAGMAGAAAAHEGGAVSDLPSYHEGGPVSPIVRFDTGGAAGPFGTQEYDPGWYYDPINERIKEMLEEDARKQQEAMKPKFGLGDIFSLLMMIAPFAIGGFGKLFSSTASAYPLQSGFGAGQFNLGNYASMLHHDGGPVKFHNGGLAPDEVRAILKKKEYVISEKGVEGIKRKNFGWLLKLINEDRFDPDKMLMALMPRRRRHSGGYADENIPEERQASKITKETQSQPTIVNNHYHINAMDALSFRGFMAKHKDVVAYVGMAAKQDNHPSRRR